MKVRLTNRDIQLLTFLGKYKMILAADTKRIYQAKEYHYKRLKILEREKYIKRVDRYYIKLDVKGIELIRKFGYEYRNICRKQDYQLRIKEIIKLATLTINSTINFKASWDVKENDIFTETTRKYIGELYYQQKSKIAYYISKDKPKVYVSQVINDIQKAVNYKDVIIFMEDYNMLNKSNHYFIFGKESTIIINPTADNLEKMQIFEKIDFYDLLVQIYSGKEILLSNWEKADYMSDKQYIILMPFIDTEKLHKLNTFYNNNQDTKRKIDIITLKENSKKINEILTNKAEIIELDDWLGGMNGEIKKV